MSSKKYPRNSDAESTLVKMVLGLKFKSWHQTTRFRFIFDLAEYLEIEETELEIIDALPGSILLTIQLPHLAAKKLTAAFCEKAKSFSPIIKFYNIEEITPIENDHSKENFLDQLKDGELIISIKTLKEILDQHQDKNDALNELICHWLEIDQLDRNAFVEEIKYHSEITSIKDRMIILAKEILNVYPTPDLKTLATPNQKSVLRISDFREIVEQRIAKGDFDGAFEILASTNSFGKKMRAIRAKHYLVANHSRAQLIAPQKQELFLENIKKELLRLLHQYAV